MKHGEKCANPVLNAPDSFDSKFKSFEVHGVNMGTAATSTIVLYVQYSKR